MGERVESLMAKFATVTVAPYLRRVGGRIQHVKGYSYDIAGLLAEFDIPDNPTNRATVAEQVRRNGLGHTRSMLAANRGGFPSAVKRLNNLSDGVPKTPQADLDLEARGGMEQSSVDRLVEWKLKAVPSGAAPPSREELESAVRQMQTPDYDADPDNLLPKDFPKPEPVEWTESEWADDGSSAYLRGYSADVWWDEDRRNPWQWKVTATEAVSEFPELQASGSSRTHEAARASAAAALNRAAKNAPITNPNTGDPNPWHPDYAGLRVQVMNERFEAENPYDPYDMRDPGTNFLPADRFENPRDADITVPDEPYKTYVTEGAEIGMTTKSGHRPLSEIASDIRRNWPNVYFGAVPYLDAMGSLDDITDTYGADSAYEVVMYLLSNMRGMRGEDARRLKAELNAILKKAR